MKQMLGSFFGQILLLNLHAFSLYTTDEGGGHISKINYIVETRQKFLKG